MQTRGIFIFSSPRAVRHIFGIISDQLDFFPRLFTRFIHLSSWTYFLRLVDPHRERSERNFYCRPCLKSFWGYSWGPLNFIHLMFNTFHFLFLSLIWVFSGKYFPLNRVSVITNNPFESPSIDRNCFFLIEIILWV